MKKLKLLLLLLLTSCTVFSQVLKPIVQQQENDTLFCFTIKQSRIIATNLQENKHKNMLLGRQESIINDLRSLTSLQKQQNQNLEKQIDHLEQIGENQEQENRTLNKVISFQKQTIKKHKKQKLGLKIALAITLIGIFIK